MLKFQKKARHEMKACFQNTVNSLDFFGQPPFFRILKKQKFNTALGHILTILLLLVCALYLYFQFSDLLSQSKPSIVISETQPLNTPAFTLNQNNFTFAISITDTSLLSLPTWKKYFDVALVACNRTRFFNETKQAQDVQLTCRNIPLERCNMDIHFPEQYQKQFFGKFILNNMLCINHTLMQENPPQLQGYTNADTYQFIQILMMPCRNSTTYQGCSSMEEQQKALSKGYYAIYLGDVLLKHDNPGRPYEDVITVQYTPYTSSISKSINSNFKMVQTNTDVGYIKEDIVEDFAILQSTSREFTGPFNQVSYVEHVVFMEQRVSNYKRTYVKVQNILGNVGGLWQLATLVITTLVTPIISTLMNLQMANRIFNFESSKNNQNESQSPYNSVRNLNEIPGSNDFIKETQNNQTKQKSEKNTDLVQNRLQLKNYLKNKKASLRIGLWDLICMNLGLQKKRKQQIDYAVEKILTKLDVVNILKKIQEIDKLKYILLNKEQLELFNYIPKPLIPEDMFSQDFGSKLNDLEQKAEFQFILQEEKPDLVKVEEAFYAFMSLQQKRQMTEIDKNILELVGEDMINIFNKMNRNQDDFLLMSNRYIHSNRNLIDQHQIEILAPVSSNSRDDNDQMSNIHLDMVNENEHNYQQNDELDEQAAQIPPQAPKKK